MTNRPAPFEPTDRVAVVSTNTTDPTRNYVDDRTVRELPARHDHPCLHPDRVGVMKRRCAYCGRVESDVHPIRRFGGGKWNRAGRWYRSSISAACARSILNCYPNVTPYAGQTYARYPVSELQEIGGLG